MTDDLDAIAAELMNETRRRLAVEADLANARERIAELEEALTNCARYLSRRPAPYLRALRQRIAELE